MTAEALRSRRGYQIRAAALHWDALHGKVTDATVLHAALTGQERSWPVL
ncbi:hypothetical protein AB0I82_04610 [Streptomyces sp. NPDC050315]